MVDWWCRGVQRTNWSRLTARREAPWHLEKRRELARTQNDRRWDGFDQLKLRGHQPWKIELRVSGKFTQLGLNILKQNHLDTVSTSVWTATMWMFPEMGNPQNGGFNSRKSYSNGWFRGTPISEHLHVLGDAKSTNHGRSKMVQVESGESLVSPETRLRHVRFKLKLCGSVDLCTQKL